MMEVMQIKAFVEEQRHRGGGGGRLRGRGRAGWSIFVEIPAGERGPGPVGAPRTGHDCSQRGGERSCQRSEKKASNRAQTRQRRRRTQRQSRTNAAWGVI